MNRKRALNRLKLMDKIGDKVIDNAHEEDDFWDDLYRRIRQKKVIPIVSNAMRVNRIFELDAGEVDRDEQSEFQSLADVDDTPVDEDLAEMWAESIGYPSDDIIERRKLSKVAQYSRTLSGDMEKSKNDYLIFLKKCLLAMASENEAVCELAADLETQLVELTFSEMVSELSLPYFENPLQDPLRILAKLRLPIYITTSYHDFLERALLAEGASKVRTLFCLWNMNESSVDKEYRPDPHYTPTAQEPLVYHLYGYEKYPRSLVLSEDDYLDFLFRLPQDTDKAHPLIPHYLRTALAESSSILMGYRLQDWDFRVLFRGLINDQRSRLRMLDRTSSVAIQLDPTHQSSFPDIERARAYLQDYFKTVNFRVKWSSTERFVDELWQEWNKRRHIDG